MGCFLFIFSKKLAYSNRRYQTSKSLMEDRLGKYVLKFKELDKFFLYVDKKGQTFAYRTFI